jgi:hypothetical protein
MMTKKSISRFWRIYTFLAPLNTKMRILECRLFVCMSMYSYVCTYAWMCASLTPERLGGFYSYSIFKSLAIIGLCPGCPVNMNILALKPEAFCDGPQKNRMAISSKTALTILILDHLRSLISASTVRLFAVMLSLMDKFAFQGKSPLHLVLVLCCKAVCLLPPSPSCVSCNDESFAHGYSIRFWCCSHLSE